MSESSGRPLRLVGASRGDPFSPFTASGAAKFLLDALDRRHRLVGRVDVSLTRTQRTLVALGSYHPSRSRWRARFYRSPLGFRLQSRNGAMRLRAVGAEFDLVVQIFGLFRTLGAPYVLYLDNTHEITRRLWPEWSPFPDRHVHRWFALERDTYRGAEHVFVTGEGVAASLRDFYRVPLERVTVVVGGTNFDPLPPVPAGPREPAIVFVGRAYAGGRLKGLDTLLEAFRVVHARMPAARLRIVGTTDVSPEEGVELLGSVSDRSLLGRVYGEAGVFCLPSRFEAYGGSSTCEAMAYGLPCVVTTVGGFPEVVVDGETGYLVAPGDAGALAEALLRVLADPARAAELGAAARRRVEEFLNWDAVVDRMAPALAAVSARLAAGEGAVRAD